MLKALNVTSGRHVVAASAAPAAAVADTATGTVSPPAVQPDACESSPANPLPAGERRANGHASPTGTAPCQNGDEHDNGASQHSARGGQDDGAAMGAATKRLKLDGSMAGVALQLHCAKVATGIVLLLKTASLDSSACSAPIDNCQSRWQGRERPHHPGRASWHPA